MDGELSRAFVSTLSVAARRRQGCSAFGRLHLDRSHAGDRLSRYEGPAGQSARRATG